MVNFYDTRIGNYWRRFKYDRVFKNLSAGELAIDCGANVGRVTEKMARSGVMVYAFEPDPHAFELLRERMAGKPNVVLFNQAVSDHDGTEKIFFNNRYNEDPGKWSTATTLLLDKPNVDVENYTMVEVIDLARFVSKLDRPIGLLKMDIEGEEIKVLNKLIDLGLVQKIRKILVETHERFPSLKQSTEALRRKIKEHGLKNIDLDWA